jgi:hypothetical protein
MRLDDDAPLPDPYDNDPWRQWREAKFGPDDPFTVDPIIRARTMQRCERCRDWHTPAEPCAIFNKATGAWEVLP